MKKQETEISFKDVKIGYKKLPKGKPIKKVEEEDYKEVMNLLSPRIEPVIPKKKRFWQKQTPEEKINEEIANFERLKMEKVKEIERIRESERLKKEQEIARNSQEALTQIKKKPEGSTVIFDERPNEVPLFPDSHDIFFSCPNCHKKLKKKITQKNEYSISYMQKCKNKKCQFEKITVVKL